MDCFRDGAVAFAPRGHSPGDTQRHPSTARLSASLRRRWTQRKHGLGDDEVLGFGEGQPGARACVHHPLEERIPARELVEMQHASGPTTAQQLPRDLRRHTRRQRRLSMPLKHAFPGDHLPVTPSAGASHDSAHIRTHPRPVQQPHHRSPKPGAPKDPSDSKPDRERQQAREPAPLAEAMHATQAPLLEDLEGRVELVQRPRDGRVLSDPRI